MYKHGDIAHASEIGRKGRSYFLRTMCPRCGKLRWTQKNSFTPTILLCAPCNKKANQFVYPPKKNI